MIFAAGVCYRGTGFLPNGNEEYLGKLDVLVDAVTAYLPGGDMTTVRGEGSPVPSPSHQPRQTALPLAPCEPPD